MKQVYRAYHWIRDHVDCGLIADLRGDLNPDDVFIHQAKVKFKRFREMFGLRGQGVV